MRCSRRRGSLTAAEWDAIRQHPVLGKTILEQAPELRDVVPAVLHHQERWDGTGYPDRLAGEAIPLPARIISAADAYHAIRSDRPYRPGRTHDEALAELCRCAGAQFDPRVVTALIGALEAEPALQDLFAPGGDGTPVGRDSRTLGRRPGGGLRPCPPAGRRARASARRRPTAQESTLGGPSSGPSSPAPSASAFSSQDEPRGRLDLGGHFGLGGPPCPTPATRAWSLPGRGSPWAARASG